MLWSHDMGNTRCAIYTFLSNIAAHNKNLEGLLMKKRISIKLLSVTLAVSSVLSIGLLTAKPTLRADDEIESEITVDALSAPVKLVTDIAKAERGYYEKKSKSKKYLYIKDKNIDKSGKKNYTKYAYEFDNFFTGFYNGKKQTVDWCDMFVDWCFVTAFGEEGARKALYQPTKSAGAGANSSMTYFKKKDGKKDKNGNTIDSFSKTPKVGDQVFFGKSAKSKKATHTGIVVAVNSKTITVVEGNSGDKKHPNHVVKSTIKKNSDKYKRIIGFGHPDYKAVSTSKTLSFVNKLYSKAIDTGLVAYKKFMYSNELACGKRTGASLVNAVFNSQSMQNLNLTDEEFINRITSVLYGRTPTEEELQQWLGALEAGEATRPDVIKGFVNTDEFVAMCKKYKITKPGKIA